jgi:hypothetical protein
MHLLFQEEPCPVTDQMLGGLYAASPDGLPTLVETIPPRVRAMLAVYCCRRAHLASIGLAIASSCDKQDLEEVAGKFGISLFDEARKTPEIAAAQVRGRRPVSLSNGMLRQVAADDDLDQDSVA